MKVKPIIMFLLVISIAWIGIGGVKNAGKPAKGTWDFKLQTVLTVEKPGNEEFYLMRRVEVSEDGRMYVLDSKVKKIFIFGPNGEFKKSFIKQGEGPGEVKSLETAQLFVVKNRVVVVEMDNFHFFSLDGDFIKSVRNTKGFQMPRVFLNENEYITAPLLKMRMASGNSSISLVNIETGAEKKIFEFAPFEGGVIRRGQSAMAVAVMQLTPMMIVGCDANRIYFGMNDTYRINVTDRSGKAITDFELNREASKMSTEEKLNFLPGGIRNEPKDVQVELVKTFPDKATFFNRIEVYNKHIFVFLVNTKNDTSQPFDIFSPDGKYLYRASIDAEKGYMITSRVVITKDFAYYIEEDEEEGNRRLLKCKISLPR